MALPCLWLITQSAVAQPGSASSLICEPPVTPVDAVVEQPVIPLQDGHALEAQQRAGTTLVYTFDATAGKSYLIEADQRGLDLVVTVESPDGERHSYDSPLRRDEREFVLLESSMPGTYTIRLQSEEHTRAIGGHSTLLQSLPDGTPQWELAAWRLITSAAEWNHMGGAEQWARAKASYEATAELARSSGDRRLQAYATYAVAMLDYWHLNAPSDSARESQDVASLYVDLNEPVLAANAKALRAAALIEDAAEAEDPDVVFAQALELFQSAAATQREFGRLYEAAHTINNIGLTHYYMGEWDEAYARWQEALPLFTGLGESSGELLAIANLGSIDFEQGHLTSAIGAFERVLDLQAPGKDRERRVDFLSNLATVQRILGSFDDALRNFSCARQVSERIDYAWGLGWALAGIGETYYGIGEFDLAEQYLNDALPIEQDASDWRGAAAVLRHLGSLEQRKGNYTAALGLHRRALEFTESPPDRALAEFEMVSNLSALGRHDEALSLAHDALAIAESTGSELLVADAHQALGKAYVSARRFGDAEAALGQALSTYEGLGMEVEQARTLNGLALATRELDELERAAAYGQESLQHVERIRGRVANPELRAYYLSARRDYLELQIDLLMALHSRHDIESNDYLMAALATSERARARLTLDLIHEGEIRLEHDDAGIERRRAELYTQLAERRYQRDSFAQSRAGAVGRSEAFQAVLSDLATIENELHLLETTARESHTPTIAVPLDASEMQAALEPGVVLLQYLLGDEKSHVWVLTHDAVHAAELPARANVDELARQVIDDLRSVGESREATARRERLADMVVGPVREWLDERTLLIAADGALQYIPFTTLSVGLADGSRQALIEDHEIVDVPSLSAISRQRESSPQEAPRKEIAVFADPVFEATDARLAGTYSGERTFPSSRPSTRAESVGSRLALNRLPLTAEEAHAILSLVPEERALGALGFDANRDTVLSAELADYRIVHLATHGLIDARYPSLSALALSQFDASGAARNGFLSLQDIFGLELNADLVVLSACETALGREVRAEGLLGLTQGFMEAGAKTLLVTLWPVSDHATAELMKAFYRYMLNEGLQPAEALRQAQQSIAAQRRWRDPYFWAGFALVGDWS